MTLSASQLRLFEFLLSFYLKKQTEFYSLLDELWSDVFWMETQIVRSDWEHKRIDEPERDRLWIEVDKKIVGWDERLGQWRFKKWYLEKFLYRLQQEIREGYHAQSAA